MLHASRTIAGLFCATALAGVAGLPGTAAACTAGTDADGTPTLSCDALRDEQLRNAVDDTRVTVTPDGRIVTPGDNAIDLRGNNQILINLGLIEGRDDSDAVRARGNDLTIENSGTMIGDDRGIRLNGGETGFVLRNFEDGVINSTRQAVRLDNELIRDNNLIENCGLIESSLGRAIQSRGANTTVINHGTLRGGEEVVEGRLDFHVVNHGLIALNGLDWDAVTRTWTNSGATDDEDGVQFSSGTVQNFGVILATDDGVDIDQGLVHNHTTGVIVSAGDDSLRDAAAVDIDEVLQIPLLGGDERFETPGRVTIVNEGYMEGPRAVAADIDAPQPVDIVNTGTMVGRSGIAIDLAPGQGDTSITLKDGSVINGDILFGGGGVNTLILGPFSDGASFGGTVSARGGAPVVALAGMGGGFGTHSEVAQAGFDVEFGDGLGLDQFRGVLNRGERLDLWLAAGDGQIDFSFLGADNFRFGGQSFDQDGFVTFFRESGVNVIPLPAAGWLLLGGLGALAALRGRRRAA